jgi:hypothetical protein
LGWLGSLWNVPNGVANPTPNVVLPFANVALGAMLARDSWNVVLGVLTIVFLGTDIVNLAEKRKVRKKTSNSGRYRNLRIRTT